MTSFPPKLAAALCAVSGNVKQLGKSDKNTFANYDFVSVDKFYAKIGSLMAEAGVHCIPDCVESEVLPGHTKTDRKTGQQVTGAPLLRERWAFTLIHESGECAGPFHRTVTVPAEGAQAHGSSESYAQKQFLRGVFRVPTGDKDDADYGDKVEHSAPVRAPAVQTPEEDRLDWGDILPAIEGVESLNAAKSREPYRMLSMAMKMSQTEAELYEWAKHEDNARLIWSLTPEARHHLREAFNTYLETL
jgi:hypothetical protein